MEVNESTIQEQIRLAKSGKQAAFNFLLNTYWDFVFGFQLKRTHNEYESEEITIQTFSKAFDKIATYKESFTFGTWLITISKNIHIDSLRKNALRKQQNLVREEVAQIVVDDTGNPEDVLIKKQNLEQLLFHLKQLKPHYQKVLQLRYFQEMSYAEMATHLSEPLSNVKVKLLRAKRLLLDIIKKYDSEGHL